jgi:hypothetical protein
MVDARGYRERPRPSMAGSGLTKFEPREMERLLVPAPELLVASLHGAGEAARRRAR